MMEGSTRNVASVEGTDPLFTSVYQRLKDMASRHRLVGGEPRTLCTTELVHEAYLKMSESSAHFVNEGQFFAYAARAIRHILTDAARRRMQPMRGGDQVRVTLGDPLAEAVQVDSQLALQLDEALVALEREDTRAARVVELHYFSGLDMNRISELMGINRRTVERDWRFARVFLAARAGT